MTAIACLRIHIGPDLQFPDAAAVVTKVATAYLEITWSRPRRFGQIAPYTFALFDPESAELDPRELQLLARQFQQKLFGSRGDGEVVLLTFEGDSTEVSRFAHGSEDVFEMLLGGNDDGTLTGKVLKITPSGIETVVPQGRDLPRRPEPVELATALPTQHTYGGVYNLTRETFVGSTVSQQAAISPEEHGAFDPSGRAPDDPIDDLETLRAVATILEDLGPGHTIFVPLDFSMLVKPGWRTNSSADFALLPVSRRNELAASILNVPRSPSYAAMKTLGDFISPHFKYLDLRISDPGFRFEELPHNLATSVTLALPEGNEATRLNAIATFMREAGNYKMRRIWQGVTDVRTRREVDFCKSMRVPFLSGPAISVALPSPLHAFAYPEGRLPYAPGKR